MAEFYDWFSFLFSARGIIKKALLGLDILKDLNIWFCLKCDVRAQLCPDGVKYTEFVEDIRQLAIREGVIENFVGCLRCGRYFLPLLTMECLKEVLTGKELADEFIELCSQCRRDDVAEGVSQAYAAASKAAGPMKIGCVKAEAINAFVREKECSGCGVCELLCPYRAIELQLKDQKRVSCVNAALCKGCGTCGAACPSAAISMQHFTDEQILAQVEALFS
jgi:Pyruvate/2-oxoacid:ferredoxin oxidoreductase delta subunit